MQLQFFPQIYLHDHVTAISVITPRNSNSLWFQRARHGSTVDSDPPNTITTTTHRNTFLSFHALFLIILTAPESGMWHN
jgi:hypothetical protein